MASQTRYRTAITVGLILLFIATRYWNFTASCLWFDEIFSVHAADHTWIELFSFVSKDLIHPPLFYALLKLWIAAGGESLAWLRSLPVFLSVLSLLPFWWLCRQLKLVFWTRCLAIFLFAVNGSVIKYSQEVRGYSLLLCLGLYSIALFTNYYIKGKNYLPLVLINVLLIYSHYFGWWIVLTEVVAVIYFQRIKWRRAVLMLGICVAAFAPWAIAVWNEAVNGALAQNIGWIERPGIRQFVELAFAFVEAFYARMSSLEVMSQFKVTVPLLAIAAVALSVFGARPRSDREQLSWRLLGLFIVLPIIFVTALSWLLPYSIWGTRHLIYLFPLFAILLAIAITRAEERWLRTGAGTLLLLFGVWGFVIQATREEPRYSWCMWDEMSKEGAAERPASVYTVEDLTAYHVWFANRGSNTSVTKLTGTDVPAEDKAYFLPRGFDGVASRSIDAVNDRSLWLAYRAPDYSESEPPLRNFLVKGYKIVDKKTIPADGEIAIMVLLEK